jgi:transposase
VLAYPPYQDFGRWRKKHYQPKLFTTFNLASRIDPNNFYRRLKDVLDLRFLYKQTELYYGKCGQKSIDPVVFFPVGMPLA